MKYLIKSNLSYLRLNKNNLEKVNYDFYASQVMIGQIQYILIYQKMTLKKKIPECFSEPIFYEIYSSIKSRE